jgi:hypothetical protein
MKFELIFNGTNILVLDGSGKILLDTDWPDYVTYLPSGVEKTIVEAVRGKSMSELEREDDDSTT